MVNGRFLSSSKRNLAEKKSGQRRHDDASALAGRWYCMAGLIICNSYISHSHLECKVTLGAVASMNANIILFPMCLLYYNTPFRSSNYVILFYWYYGCLEVIKVVHKSLLIEELKQVFNWNVTAMSSSPTAPNRHLENHIYNCAQSFSL